MDKLWHYCAILIFLVVSIPIASSGAYARLDAIASGDRAVPGFRNSRDTTTVEAHVNISTDNDISPGQLKADSAPFTSCVPASMFINCTYKASRQTGTNPGKQTILVELFYDNGALAESRSIDLYTDNTPPAISSLTTNKDLYGDEPMTVGAAVTDGPSDSCSGPKYLRVVGDLVKEYNFTGTQCSQFFSRSIPSRELFTGSGVKRLCLVAEDRLELASPPTGACKTVTIDYAAPSITAYWAERDGHATRWTNGQGNADIRINVSEPADSAVANLSAFIDGLEGVPGMCVVHDDNTSTCSWNIPFRINPAATQVRFQVTDFAGNTLDTRLSRNVQLDTVKPNITALVSESALNGVSFVRRQNNTIKATYIEADSGIDQMYLDLSTVGGTNRMPSSSCGNGMCLWRDVRVQTTQPVVTLRAYGNDNAGNPLVGNLTGRFVVDYSDPQILNITINSSTGYCPTKNDEVRIRAIVQDYGVTLTANASTISTTAGWQGTCTRRPDANYSCAVDIQNIKDTQTTGKVTLTFTDTAGNNVTESVDIEICGSIAATTPIQAQNIALIPAQVDKYVASTNGQMLFATFNYYFEEFPNDPSAQVVSQSVDCSESSNYLRSAQRPFFLDLGGGKRALVVVVKGSTSALNASRTSFWLNCTIHGRAIAQGVVYTEDINVPFKVQVPLYNLPQGSFNQSVTDRMALLDREISDLEKNIQKKEDTWNYVGGLCSLLESLGNLNALLQAATAVIDAVACVLFGATVTAGAETGLTKIMKGLQTYGSFYTKWLWDPSGFGVCNTKVSTGKIMYYACSIYACKLCDATWWGQQLQNAAGSGGSEGFTTTTTFTAPTSTQGPITRTTTHYGGNPALSHIPMDTSYIIDPFKSIHAASACLCMPGYMLALKKEKQIKCLQRTCIEKMAAAGLPASYCDESYAVRECLYVQGSDGNVFAQLLKNFFPAMWDTFTNDVPMAALTVINGVCSSYSCSPPSTTTGNAPGSSCSTDIPGIICELARAASNVVTILDLIDQGVMSSRQASIYAAELDRNDFCGGAEPTGGNIIQSLASPKLVDWYTVSDREVEACTKYGGTVDSYTASGSSYTVDYSTGDNAALQGTFTKLVGKTQYEVSWYVLSMTNSSYNVTLEGSQEYSVALNKNLVEKREVSGILSPLLIVNDTDAQYDHAVLVFNNHRIRVPVVEKAARGTS